MPPKGVGFPDPLSGTLNFDGKIILMPPKASEASAETFEEEVG